jgi:cellulose synthase (UDP-forming)
MQAPRPLPPREPPWQPPEPEEQARRAERRGHRAAGHAPQSGGTSVRQRLGALLRVVGGSPEATKIVLPVPPSDKEKYSYVRRHTWVLTVCSGITIPPLVYSQIRLFEHSPWFLLYAPFLVLATLFFLLPLIADGLSKGFDLAMHRRLVAQWQPRAYPTVDVWLPTAGEPMEVLRNTWKYVSALRTAYQGKLTPYVLDDGARPEVKRLAKEFGFAYATRPNRGWYKKSGNLKYAYEISDGDFILLLDADFCPRADLLDETLPYFDAFPDVGIVQTPQYFHVEDSQTWVERGAGAVQELFYRSVQTARDSSGSAICVGSCAVYRRAALDQNDGMSLAEHSEDVHTGFDLYRLGWRLRYLPVAVSTGNCPENIPAFVNQQYRWCSGTVSVVYSEKFWETRLPLRARLGYLAGLTYYAYTAIFTFVGPALGIGLLAFAPGILAWRNMIYVVPGLFYAGVIYPMWHRSPYRLEAWSVRVLSSWAHVFALTDMMRGRLKGWQASGSGAKKQDGRRRLWAGILGWSLASASVWVGVGLWRMMTMDPFNIFLTFVLGVFQLVVVARILLQPGKVAG